MVVVAAAASRIMKHRVDKDRYGDLQDCDSVLVGHDDDEEEEEEMRL